MKKIKQHTQINKSTTYDDTLPAGATLESAATSLEDDLNAIRSQLEKIIGSGNWYDVYVAPADSDELVKVSGDDTTPGFLLAKLSAGTGISISETSPGGNETLEISTTVVNTDNFVKVSAVDTTSDYLASKLVAGANVTLTPSGAGNETLTVAAVIPPGSDEAVKVSVDDTTPGFLLAKLSAGTGISLTESSPGGNESLEISTTVVNTDNFVKVSAVDTTSNYLASKLVAGANVTLTPSGAGNETLTVAAVIPPDSDELVKVSVDDTTPGFLLSKLSAGTGISITESSPGGNETLEISTTVVNTDNFVKVSAVDTTSDYLASKLVAGANVTLTPSGAGNETLTVAAVIPPDSDEAVKVSVDDTTPGFLDGKLLAGAGITFTVGSPAGNETLTIAASGIGSDELVKVSVGDSTAEYLDSKIVAGSGISVTTLDFAGKESLQISSTVTNTDESVKASATDPVPGYLLDKLQAGSNITITLDDSGLSEFVDIEGPTDSYIEGLAENHVTLKNAVDNQITAGLASISGVMDVALANNSTWRFADSVPTLFLQWGVDGVGGTFFDTYGDITRLNSSVVEIGEGVTISANTGNPIEVGITLGVISTPLGDLTVSGLGGDLVLEDSYKASSTYGTPLVLADSAAEWSAFETEFGEVSILNAVVQAAGTGDNQVKVSANDATTGFLNGKLVAGAGISLTENNDGSAETLTVASTVALDDVVDKQGATPVTSDTFIYVNMANGTGWVFRNSAGVARVSLLAGSTGLGAFTCAVQSFTVDNTNTAEFFQGISVDSDDFPINIGATAGQIEFTGTGDKTIVTTGTTTKLRVAPTGILELDGGTKLTFEDQYKAGLPIEFSKSGADWTNYNTLFQVSDNVFSLLRAIYTSAFYTSVDGTLAGIGTLETKIKGTQGVGVKTKSNELVVSGRGISNDFFGVLPTLASEAYTGWYFAALASGSQQIVASHFAGTSGLIQILSSSSGSSGGIVRTSGRTAIGTAGELHATLRVPTSSAVSHTGIFLHSSASTPTSGLWATHEGTSIRLVSASGGVYNNSSAITTSTGSMYRIKISWSGGIATLEVFFAITGALVGSASVAINAPTSTGYPITHLAFRSIATAGVISYLDYICYTPLSLI